MLTALQWAGSNSLVGHDEKGTPSQRAQHFTKENHIMYIPEAPLKYKVVSHGALPSAVRPRIEYGIEQLLNREQFSTNEKRFGRNVTTRKTRIA